MSIERLLAWARSMLAPDTYERTMAAAYADLLHELATLDGAARARAERRGRWMLMRVLWGAMCEDRRIHRRGVAWWRFGGPLLAVVAGFAALPGDLGIATQLAFLAPALVLGFWMAGTPRRVIAREAVGAAWIAVTVVGLVAAVNIAAEPSGDRLWRWITIGPLRIHAATCFLPFVALGLGALACRGATRHLLALGTAALASVAATADLAMTVVYGAVALASGFIGAGARGLVVVPPIAVAIVVAALVDPGLAAVPRSEGVIAGLAEHPLGLALALIALAAAIAAPLAMATRDRWARAVGVSAALALVVPLALNPFVPTPIPLLGYGGSAIVAAFLALGATLSLARAPTGDQGPRPSA